MFKKLILLVLIALLAILAATGCSSDKEQPAPTTTPSDKTEPVSSSAPQTSTTKAEPKKAISVTEFVEKVLRGEYRTNDIVLISGTVYEVLMPSPVGPRNYLNFWVKTSEDSELVVVVGSEYVFTIDKSDPGYKSFMSFAKVKSGDKITVKGTYGSLGDNRQRISVVNATVQ